MGCPLKFSREAQNAYSIRSVEADRIVVGDTGFVDNFGIWFDGVIADWPATGIDELDVAALEPLLSPQPEMLLLGTGWRHRLPPRDLTFALAHRGLGLEVMDTPAACRTFNILLAEGRRAAAIIYF